MDVLKNREPSIPLTAACVALDVPRATAYRHLFPSPKVEWVKHPKRPSHRRISEPERTRIYDHMHSDRFIDQTVYQAHAELLDEGVYIASPRTFYRVLAERGETKDRRDQRAPRSHTVPRLEATKPNEVWTWDISKLATYVSGVFLNLYLILDLYSRFPVAWMIAERENSALSKQLFAEAISRHGIEPGTLIAHNDRGAPMTAIGFTELLGELGVEPSLSRPRVSNDNPFSESCFKTIKQQPDYPGKFTGTQDARQWFHDFFDWYANHHRHSGLAFFTPADVFSGKYEDKMVTRQRAMNEAFAAHPERFVKGRTIVKVPPAAVYINPVEPEARTDDKQLFAVPSSSSTAPANIICPGTSHLSGDELRKVGS